MIMPIKFHVTGMMPMVFKQAQFSLPTVELRMSDAITGEKLLAANVQRSSLLFILYKTIGHETIREKTV